MCHNNNSTHVKQTRCWILISCIFYHIYMIMPEIKSHAGILLCTLRHKLNNKKAKDVNNRSKEGTSQQAWDIHPMPFQCWPTVFDAGPPLKQHWVKTPCLLGWCIVELLTPKSVMPASLVRCPLILYLSCREILSNLAYTLSMWLRVLVELMLQNEMKWIGL